MFSTEWMRILKRETRKWGHENKRQQWQGNRFAWILQMLFVNMYEDPSARATRRGPSRSTIVVI